MIQSSRVLVALFVPALALALTAAGPAVAGAENWPHWRGPNLDGTSSETGLPTEWHAAEDGTKNVRWRVDLPGPAGSSPIVWDDTVYLTTTSTEGDALSVLAIDTDDGSLRWQTNVDSGNVEVFEMFAHETNAAASSPVTDGEHIWAIFGTGKLYRIATKDGAITWTVDLAQRYGAPSLYFGYSASPLLLDGRLYLQLLHADAQLVVALDASTGEEIWKTERPSDSQQESRQSYASVLPFRTGDSTQILIHGSDYLTGHEPGSGNELWRFGTLNPEESYNPMYRFVTSPVVHQDLIVVPTAKRGPVFGLRPGSGSGALTTHGEHVAWTLERGTPDVPSPVVADGIVYLSGENGRLTALDVASGEEIYAERAHQSQHRGSPIAADGKIYLTGSDGTVTVVKAGHNFEVLAKNTVEAGRLAASPAVSGGVIYLRTYEALFAVAEGETEETSSERPASRDSESR